MLVFAQAASADAVMAFGDNVYGQCDVPSWASNVSHVGASRRTSAAVMADGTIAAWGYDINGEVSGVPFPPEGRVFTKVFGGEGFVLLGLTNDGQLISWGRNTVGQADVPGLPAGKTYVKASVGMHHGAALRNDGRIITWGCDDPTQYSTTVKGTILTVPSLPTGKTYTDVAVGNKTTLALRNDGLLFGWGYANSGELSVPALPAGVTWTGVALTSYFAVGLRSDGTVAAWGDNTFQQVSGVPVAPAGKVFTAITAGGDHALARLSDGTWVGWGSNFDGEANTALLPAGTLQQVVACGDRNVVRYIPAACGGDLDQSSAVDAGDIGSLLLLFGECPGAVPGCSGDLDSSGAVDAGDIGALLLQFGECP